MVYFHRSTKFPSMLSLVIKIFSPAFTVAEIK